ncbi:hypothetical protein [Streptomyces sp. NBC_00483]|uniref:hypothetical protein n=1 Tax=Streptomyces sp. NBC_00483 TaxID=2975756 RepID=UPI002E16E77C
MNFERDALGWAAMAASIAVTAHGEWSLAVASGYAPVVAAGLPIAIDAYAIRAMRAGREIFPPVLLMVATNAAAHLLKGGMLTVAPWLVVLVSAIAPVVLWRVHALHRHEAAAPEPQPVEYEQAPAAEPVPETKPEPARPVPVAVPESARLLPTFECRGELQRALRNERPALVPAAEHARTRPEVHAEYVPEPPHDDDPLTEAGLNDAAEQFRTELLAGDLPPIREIKARLRVGQNRAKEIQEAFRQALPQLTGAGATS